MLALSSLVVLCISVVRIQLQQHEMSCLAGRNVLQGWQENVSQPRCSALTEAHLTALMSSPYTWFQKPRSSAALLAAAKWIVTLSGNIAPPGLSHLHSWRCHTQLQH